MFSAGNTRSLGYLWSLSGGRRGEEGGRACPWGEVVKPGPRATAAAQRLQRRVWEYANVQRFLSGVWTREASWGEKQLGVLLYFWNKSFQLFNTLQGLTGSPSWRGPGDRAKPREGWRCWEGLRRLEVLASLLLHCLFLPGTLGLPSRRLHPVYIGNEEKTSSLCILHLRTYTANDIPQGPPPNSWRIRLEK